MNNDDLFLADNPASALENLAATFEHHVLPFLSDWWTPARPIPTAEEIAAIGKAVESRVKGLPMPPGYEQFPELLKKLSEAMRFNRRNFINIHPSPFLPSILASLVVALQNPNNIVEEVSRPTWEMEGQCIDWIADNLLSLPRDRRPWGNVVSGGTLANMTALLVARDYTYDKLSRPRSAQIGARGVINSRNGVVLATAGSHYSLEKALWFLGIGHENLIRVPVCWDEAAELKYVKERRFVHGIQGEPWKSLIDNCIDVDQKRGERELQAFYGGEQCPFSLQPLDSEILKTLYSCFEFNVPLLAFVLTLGTTDTGTIENANSFAIEQLRKEDIFVHADAASGGFAFLSERIKPKLIGLESVDSFTIDAHKMGFLHYPCGAVVFKDEDFKHQIYHEAPYLGALAPTLEGSRSATGIAALWLAIQTLGASGYREKINHLLDFTQELVRNFEATGKYQVLHKVDLTTVAVAPIPLPGESRTTVNSLVNSIRKRVKESGEFLVNIDRHLAGVKVRDNHRFGDSTSKIVDIESLRIVVTNPLVEIADAQRIVEILTRHLDQARSEYSD
jgi:glutamate/tyrosine decarboxylase-like PLP-dependent enzyme